jgi:hypothetical protein
MNAEQLIDTYEKEEFLKIDHWKNLEPTVFSKINDTLFKPANWLIQKVIPEKAIHGVLVACNSLSELTLDKNNFKKQNKISSIEELKNQELKKCDELANEIHNWAIGYATTEGGLTGAAGFLGMAIDIPFVITLAFRTIHKVGLCYGFEHLSEEDNQRIFSIMALAGSNTMKEKQIALITLKQIHVLIAKNTWKHLTKKAAENQISREGGIIAIKALAKSLGINLTKRKALQTIPFVGSGVGAAVNASYINDISWAARRVFQEAWLSEKYEIAEVVK